MIVAKKEHNNRLAKRELMLMIAIHWVIIGKRHTQRGVHTTKKERGWEERKRYLLLWCLFLINNI